MNPIQRSEELARKAREELFGVPNEGIEDARDADQIIEIEIRWVGDRDQTPLAKPGIPAKRTIALEDRLFVSQATWKDQAYELERGWRLGLSGDTPGGNGRSKNIEGPSKLVSFPVCGGLHHRYDRVAA